MRINFIWDLIDVVTLLGGSVVLINAYAEWPRQGHISP